MALVPSLLIVAGLAGMSVALTASRQGSAESAARLDEGARIEAVADAVSELAISVLWNDFLATNGGVPGSLDAFRTFLDFRGIASSGTPGVAFNATVRQAPEETSIVQDLNLTFVDNIARFGGAEIHEVEVLREDILDGVALRVSVEVGYRGDAESSWNREAARVFTIAGAEFEGFDFALLANNINCIMCHASFDNALRAFNNDARREGTFGKVRVGALESLQIRPTNANTVVAGTIYTRGPILDDHGRPINNIGATSLKSAEFNAAGRLTDPGGTLIGTSLSPAQTLPGQLAPEAGANLYTNYPEDPALQPDGFLPESFPPVIPDPNGNRAVDPEEFAELASRAQGRIEAGNKILVPPGQQYGEFSLPSQDEAGILSGTVNGNLVLVGTPENPIKLDGRVAISGDVVITGFIEGDGEIAASGNVYIVGPLRYADGTDAEGNRIFGRSASGRMNRLALGAGGNVVVGDYLQRAGWLGADSLGFAEREMMAFNRMEWAKTQPMLPGENGTTVVNPLFDPTHRPRYYAETDTGEVHIWTGGRSWFDPNTQTWNGAETYDRWSRPGRTTLTPGDPRLANATVVPILPSSSWFSEATLQRMWSDAEQFGEGARGFDIDGLIYTNNMALWLNGRRGNYNGKAMVNGSIVAADVGILLPGNGDSTPGLQLNYDPRLRGALGIRDTERVEVASSMRIY